VLAQLVEADALLDEIGVGGKLLGGAHALVLE
jgi:hypothetical protein